MAEVESDLPWDDYSRDRLPAGWAYPLGRDRIEHGLRVAGAKVGSLSLVGMVIPRPTGVTTVAEVLWFGDASPGFHPAAGLGGYTRLMMRWWAVPSACRRTIEAELEHGWLARVCDWTAGAVTRGNAWAATKHSLEVVHHDGSLSAIER